jgi:hypothetical protein
MKNLFRFLLLFIVIITFVSCETDFDVIADYKEVAIVYGLLDQSEAVHYLRINKAFLGKGNAISYAQIADSSSFGVQLKSYWLIQLQVELVKTLFSTQLLFLIRSQEIFIRLGNCFMPLIKC